MILRNGHVTLSNLRVKGPGCTDSPQIADFRSQITMASKSESGKVHPIFWCIFVISILFGIAGIVLIAYSVITIGLASGKIKFNFVL